MAYKKLNFTPSILLLFSLLFFQGYSYASKEHAHDSDFYEAIIQRDSSRVLSLCPSTTTESLPSTSAEWFKAMEETLVSLAFSYKDAVQERTPASGIPSSELEERLSSLLNFSKGRNLLFAYNTSNYYRSFSEGCAVWSHFDIRALSQQERLAYLVYKLAEDTRTSQHLQAAAYFTLLFFIDSKEHVGTSLACALTSLINAKRFDLTSTPLEEYCSLGDADKKFSDIALFMRTFLENERFAEFEKLLGKHISSLTKEENPSEKDVMNLLFAFRAFWKGFGGAEKNPNLPFLCKFLLSHIKSFPDLSSIHVHVKYVLCRAFHCQSHPDTIAEFKILASDPDLEILFKSFNLSTGQHEFILQGFLDCLSEFKAGDDLKSYEELIGKAYNLSQIYLQLMDQSKDKSENLSRSSLNCLSDIYYLYAIVLAMDEKKYEASIAFIRETFIPFIEKNKKKDPSWQEQKVKAVCLLCLVAFKTPDASLAKKQLSYIFSLIGELERFDHPSAKETLPFIKVIAGNLFIKSKDVREKDTGKKYLRGAFEKISKEFDRYTKDDDQSSIDSNLVFFLLNGLEEAGMEVEARQLSRLLIESNLRPQRKAGRQPRTPDASRFSRRGKGRQKLSRHLLVEQAKAQQKREQEQREALDRGKRAENSPSKERKAGSSTETRSEVKGAPIEIAPPLEKKADQILSVSPDASPERSDSDSQKPKKEKIKTRKAPIAEPSSSSDSNDSLSASETSAEDMPAIDLDQYLDLGLLKNKTFLDIFQPNHKRGKITLHDFKSLLGVLGGSLRGGNGSHTKATLPHGDFLGLVLTIPHHTDVKPYILNNLRDILTDIGLTPEALEKHMADKQNAAQKRNL